MSFKKIFSAYLILFVITNCNANTLSENILPDSYKFGNSFINLTNRYSPIKEDLKLWVEKQGNLAEKNIALGVSMKYLWQSYQSSGSAYSKWLAGYGRVWTYDAALGLYSVLIQKDYERAGLAVDNFMNVIRAEKKKGYKGLFHFSYNTRGDDFIDPREPQGATQWVLKALYAYMLETGDLSHFNELTSYVIKDILPMQILDPKHPAYGLLRQGYMHKKGLRQGGYNIYEEVDELNVLSHGVNMEHNADFIDFLRLITSVVDKYKNRIHSVGSDFRAELKKRHALCMQATLRIRKDKHWPTAFDQNGKPNWSMAIDHYSWLSHAFMDVKNNRDIPWESIKILYNEFTTTTKTITVFKDRKLTKVELTKPAKGLFFFTWDFQDSFVEMPHSDRLKLEEMIQPEATAGAIIMLMDFVLTSKNEERRKFAYDFMVDLFEGLAEIHKVYKTIEGYAGGGMPYATETIPDFFGPDPSLAAGVTYQIAITKLTNNYSNFLGIKAPEGFENALIENIDPQSIPSCYPLPDFSGNKIDKKTFTSLTGKVEEIAKQLSFNSVQVKEGRLFVNLTYPEKYRNNLEIIVMKKTDRWYFQPKRLGTKSVGQSLPKPETDTHIETYDNNLDENTMAILAIKGHDLKPSFSMSGKMLDSYFEKGIFVIGIMGNGEMYVD